MVIAAIAAWEKCWYSMWLTPKWPRNSV